MQAYFCLEERANNELELTTPLTARKASREKEAVLRPSVDNTAQTLPQKKIHFRYMCSYRISSSRRRK